MFLLTLVVLVAAAGILKLWIIQRRERAGAGAIDCFFDSLKRLSEPRGEPHPRNRVSAPALSATEESMTDARRVAARRRIQARRQAGISG